MKIIVYDAEGNTLGRLDLHGVQWTSADAGVTNSETVRVPIERAGIVDHCILTNDRGVPLHEKVGMGRATGLSVKYKDTVALQRHSLNVGLRPRDEDLQK